MDELDGVIFPGGYGAAKNLCSYASEGIQCSVNPDIDYLIRTLHEQKNPLDLSVLLLILRLKCFQT